MNIHFSLRLILLISFVTTSSISFGQFTEVKKLFDNDGGDNDEYGFEVAISNGIAIVGARNHDEGGSNSGAAYIYGINQGGVGNWGLIKKLQPSDLATFDAFGIDVDIHGDRAIVGSSNDDDNGNNSGSVYVFEKDQGGANNWGQVKKIVANESTFRFAENIALHDDLVIAGAIYDAIGGIRAGAAYVFERNHGGSNNWGQVKKLKANDPAADDRFGENVDISNDYAVVGSRLDDDNGNFSGSAYVFGRNNGGSNNWGQVKKLLPSDGDSTDNFGSSVVVEGDIVAVGAWGDTDDGFRSGSVYIFEKNEGGTDNWGEIKKVQSDVFKPLVGLGWSIAMNNGVLIAGAPTEDVAAGDSGAAYIYEQNVGGANNWGFVQKIVQSGGGFNDRFGESVRIDGDLIIVGSNLDDDNGSNQGSAYIFEKPPTCEINPITTYLDQTGISVIDTSDLVITNFGLHDTVFISRTTLICTDVLMNPLIDSLIGITGTDTTICIFEVTVLDTISPTATCQDITTYLDSFGLVIVSPIDIPHTTNDNCAANLIRVFPNDFSCASLGDNSAIFQTIDPSGNTGDCPLTISVLDTFPPFTDCKEISVYLDQLGSYSLTPDDINNMVHLTYDNCSIDSIGINKDVFSCNDIPISKVTLTFRDLSGNISACEVDITVLDTIAPTLDCPETLALDLLSDSQFTFDLSHPSLTSTDNCGIDSIDFTKSLYTCFDLPNPERAFFNSLNLSNTTDYADCGVFSELHNDSSYTIEFWLFETAFSSGENYIGNYENQNNRLVIGTGGGGFADDLLINIGNSSASIGDGITLNTWEHWAIVVDGSKTTNEERLIVYKNGVLQFPFISGTVAPSFPTNNKSMLLGLNFLSNSVYTECIIDEVRFWSTIRTSSEINNYKNQCLVGNEEGLEVYYDMSNDFLDGFIKDIAGNHNASLENNNYPQFESIESPEISCGSEMKNTISIWDISGNSSTCTIDITATDIHGYCCPDELTVNSLPIDPIEYYASDSIQSKGNVSSGTNVNFRSTVIKIDTTFQVESGGVFQAINEDCNN